jgi:hypothetical protein
MESHKTMSLIALQISQPSGIVFHMIAKKQMTTAGIGKRRSYVLIHG